MSLSPESGLIKRAISGLSLNSIAGGISNMGMALIAKYPFISTLLDSVTGASATFTRSTVKTYIKDDGTVATAAIDAPAYTGSGVLLEGTSTNLMTYSYDATNAAWTKIRLDQTTADSTGPDGATSAGLLTVNASSGSGAILRRTLTISSGQQQTIKTIVKQGTTAYILIEAYDVALANGIDVYFDLATGALGNQSATGSGWSIARATISPLANGFYECKVVVNTTGTGLVYFMYVGNALNSGACTAGNTIYYYNISCQENDTSIIRNGTAAALTRTSDVFTIPTTNAPVNDFSYYFKYTPKLSDAETTYIFIDYKDANNSIFLVYTAGIDSFELSVTTGGVTRNAALVYATVAGTEYECLVKVSPTFISLVVEASSVTTTSAGPDMSHATAITLYDAGTLFTAPQPGELEAFKIINSSNITLAQAAAL